MRSRKAFKALQCRGFSFSFLRQPKMANCFVRGKIDLRFALAIDRSLYYPPRVRTALDIHERRPRHLQRGIGWALGRRIQTELGTVWFILNLQSDVASSASSQIRGHFRGWQRVLMSSVFDEARKASADLIALPTAHCLARSSMWSDGMPQMMFHIYDDTSKFFGLKRLRMRQSVDIETVLFGDSTPASTFWMGAVNSLCRKYPAPFATWL
ncbi:MAG: hypothetical protein O2960_25535 [Verrucomicrobia bacterium]|nr:hypothetical protein [Verrucomicrobiota bacterium]